MLHDKVERFLEDPGATRIDFIANDRDGCWLWCESGGGRILGIPIDVDIFRIHPAPYLLARYVTELMLIF